MSVDEAEANYEAARAALEAFEERKQAALAALKEEQITVNAAYRAADDALLVARTEAAGPNDAPAQTVEG